MSHNDTCARCGADPLGACRATDGCCHSGKTPPSVLDAATRDPADGWSDFGDSYADWFDLVNKANRRKRITKKQGDAVYLMIDEIMRLRDLVKQLGGKP